VTQCKCDPGAAATTSPAANPIIGVWTDTYRNKIRVLNDNGEADNHGPKVKVSRLGNPLFNEVIVPLGKKDYWNKQSPRNDAQFAQYVANPELANLIPVLYPGVFPHLATLDASKASRADLLAILLTGLPSGIITGFQNYTGPKQADLLRLNLAIPPSSKPNILGILGGDLAGFPNGRRVFDDTVTIELRAIAGVTIPLVDPSYKPDKAAGEISDFNPPQIPEGVS